jgi:hypothetical protein
LNNNQKGERDRVNQEMERHMNFKNMCMAFVVLTFVSCAAGVTKQDSKPKFSIVGRWEGVDRTGRFGAFVFNENGKVTLIIDGKPLGNQDASDSGFLKYSIDFSKDPIELDIIGFDESGARRGNILMIVRIIASDSMKIRTYFNETRPVNFDNETPDDTIMLKRKTD